MKYRIEVDVESEHLGSVLDLLRERQIDHLINYIPAQPVPESVATVGLGAPPIQGNGVTAGDLVKEMVREAGRGGRIDRVDIRKKLAEHGLKMTGGDGAVTALKKKGILGETDLRGLYAVLNAEI